MTCYTPLAEKLNNNEEIRFEEETGYLAGRLVFGHFFGTLPGTGVVGLDRLVGSHSLPVPGVELGGEMPFYICQIADFGYFRDASGKSRFILSLP